MGTKVQSQETGLTPSEAVSDPVRDDTEDQNQGSFADYARIFHFADRYDWMLNAVSLVVSIASGSVMPLMTVIFGQFTNKFTDFNAGKSTPDDFKAGVNSFVLWFVYLFVARFIVGYIATLTISISSIRTTRALREALLSHMLRMEIWHFDLPATSSPATQLTTNTNRVNQGIAERLVIIIQAVVTLVASFIVAMVVQWKLALITMTCLPVIFVVTGVCMSIDVVHEAQIMTTYSHAASVADEALSSIRTVHAFWAHEKLLKRYNAYLDKAHRLGNKKSINYGLLYSTEYFCVYAAVALSFWQGYRMYASGEIEGVGTVFTVELATLMAATSISSLAPHLTSITNAAAAASELFKIMDKPSLLDPLDSSGQKPDHCTGEIQLCNLHFSYPSRPTVPVLRDLTLSVPDGKTTALVGASGSGKSTVVGLLQRWYQADSGKIVMDGVELSQLNTKWLRTQIRLVQQEPVLFQGTVFENVANGLVGDQKLLPDVEKRRLVEMACKSANAHTFIQLLPKAYDTEVGERAGMISGGQKQRIAIARSIISNPKVLLLDEATSALDPTSEKVVQEALNRVSKDRTTVMIAHRLSTVKNADNIIVMSAGQVIEQGTHHELIDRNGHYAKLVAAQELDVSATGIVGSGNDDKERHTTDFLDEDVPQRTSSAALSPEKHITHEVEEADPTMPDYSVLRCIFMFLAEEKSLYGLIIIAIAGCIIAAGTFPGQAVIFSRLTDVFITRTAAKDSNFWALMLFIVALGNLICYFVLGVVCNLISQSCTHRYRLEMFQHIIKMDISFFDLEENNSGALSSKLSTVPTLLQELISFNFFTMLIIFANITFSSVLALAYGWKLGLVVTFGGLPALIGSGYLRMRIETALENQNEKRFARSAGLASEAVGAIRTIASLTLESDYLDRYRETLSDIVFRSTKTLVFMMIPYALSQSMEYLVMALGFWYGSRLLASGEYTTSQFFIIFLSVLFAGQAAGQFFAFSSSLSKGRGAANYFLWLRRQTPTVQETEQNKDNGPDPGGDLILDKVHFSYPQRGNTPVLKDISMDIHFGQFVAFVGASGCGKSTLIALLERFYDLSSGRLLIGGTDIKDFSPRLHRQHISLVQQEQVLYQGSVRENISLGITHEPTDDELEAACRQANAWDFVASLPQGLDTPCGGRGLSFSGGQRQRIAIARALIRNPRLLLLDEATSALDTQSERIVQAALDGAAKEGGRTMVAVAHRLSTIRNADVIYVFANGRIAECGTHEELQRRRGMYYEMCSAQSLDRTL